MSLPLRTNYLYGRIKKSLPEMYAFTVCMWLKSSASPGIGTPFSYGVPGQANEIVLIEWGNNPIELLVNDKVGNHNLMVPGFTHLVVPMEFAEFACCRYGSVWVWVWGCALKGLESLPSHDCTELVESPPFSSLIQWK